MRNNKRKVIFLITGLILLICIFFVPETGILQRTVNIFVMLYIAVVAIDVLISTLMYFKKKRPDVG